MIGESRAMTDKMEFTGGVVQAEQQRPDLPAVLVLAVPPNDAVDRSAMLPLDHLPFALEIRGIGVLAHDAITTRRFELVEPAAGDLNVVG